MSNTSIIANNLKVKLSGITVLDAISFSLLPQQHLAIVGESGSGKTTLAKALAGQIFHEGTVTIESTEGQTKKILFVEQRNQFKNLSNLSSFYYQQRFNSTESEDAATAEQEIIKVAETIIKDEAQRAEAIDEWLTHFRMQHRRYTPVIQLSNGEHKRLQLIKALLFHPKVLILDQPFTGLDVTSREELHNIITHLSEHTTIILITGSNQIPACITHVAYLNKGILKSYTQKKDFKGDDSTQHFFLSSKPLPQTTEQTNFITPVKMHDVTVKYGAKTILQNINWQVNSGDKWLVRGPNGAGKSTLLSLLTGDNPQAYANEIYLFDKRRGTGESIWDIKKKIGYVSPEIHWYFDKGLTVYTAVASGFFDTMGLYRQLSTAQEKLLAQWIAYFNLTGIQRKPLSLLSSGQQRLVLLARALVKNPPLLILDEPCQGLDDNQVQDFASLIDELCTKANKTLIYVSHYEHEIPACIDKKLELDNGIATISVIHNRKTVAA